LVITQSVNQRGPCDCLFLLVNDYRGQWFQPHSALSFLEQAAMKQLINSSEQIRNHVKTMRQRHFNSYVSGGAYGSQRFILHFAGRGDKWDQLKDYHAKRSNVGGQAGTKVS
jgi:hypothetical protein